MLAQEPGGHAVFWPSEACQARRWYSGCCLVPCGLVGTRFLSRGPQSSATPSLLPWAPAPPGQPLSVPTAVGEDLVAGARDAGGGSRGTPGITRVGVSRALPGRTLCPSPSPDTDIDVATKHVPGAQGLPTPSPPPGLMHGLDGLKLAGGVTQQEAASLRDHVDGRGLGPGGHRVPSSGRSVCPDATFVEGVLSAASSCPEKP